MTAHCKPDPTEYAPYHHYAEFWHGVADYDENLNRYADLLPMTEIRRQAYDRGAVYAMRLARWVAQGPRSYAAIALGGGTMNDE